MPSLLEIKRSGGEWKKIIFPTASLPFDNIDPENWQQILEKICQELSNYLPGDLFMPHDVRDVVIDSFDEDDFNSCEWAELKDTMYEIVISFTDIVFSSLNNHANVVLISVDDSTTIVSYQLSPAENF